MKTRIIAEAGVNHNGSLTLAKQLVDVAVEAGVDMVKFQTFSADRLAIADAPKAGYQLRSSSPQESQRDMLRRLELNEADHYELQQYCESRKIEFFSTGFDVTSLDLLANLGLKMFKVPSGEITNLPYLRRIASLADEVLLSTGMANLGEVEAAVDVLLQAGMSRRCITVLHCTTEYPAPMAEVNLRAMANMGNVLGLRYGYSDHTQGIEVPVAAVALGACVIEKHFTLDRDMLGPDHKASLEPDELCSMVRAIRNIERALGDGVKCRTASEIPNIAVARKSIVAARSIGQGEQFTESNVTALRPGTGLSPMRWDEVMGRKAARAFQAGEQIEL
jgi:N,N'-diacetyllegionaminate synthase